MTINPDEQQQRNHATQDFYNEPLPDVSRGEWYEQKS